MSREMNWSGRDSRIEFWVILRFVLLAIFAAST